MRVSVPTGKQAQSIIEAHARHNVWEGSVSSGKTIASILRWLEFVADGPPGDLLMAGKTERTLKRNILDVCEGFVGRKGYRLKSGSGEVEIFGRRIYLAGANDERSEGKIRGLTIAGAYGDEVTLWPESFFTMLISRLRVPGAKGFYTTNPDGPFHWFKQGYLDRSDELDVAHWHFTLDDNPHLDPAYVREIKREYTGLWYKRFILGLWVMAEGAIYDCFDESLHVVQQLPKMRCYWTTIDYGTTNPTVFLLLGEGEDNRMYVVREYRWDSAKKGRQKTDREYSADYRQWIGDVDAQRVFHDPSAASFGLQLYRDGVRRVTKADNDVLDGIRETASLLAAGRLLVHASCKGLIEELPGYVWDAKQAKKGIDAPVKAHDHALDALRYGIRGTQNVWRRWIRQEAA